MKYFLFVSLGFLLACTSNEPTSPSAKSGVSNGKVLVFARPGDSIGLDPARNDDGESLNITTNIFEGLVRMKLGTTELEPGLATKWKISQDGKEYDFELREGVKFHDGTAFNADAVVFAIERQWKKDHQAYNFLKPYKYWDTMGMSALMESVEKTGEYSVKIKLKRSNAPFLASLAMPFMAIPSPTAVMELKEDFDTNPVGTGPYTLESWQKDDAMVLKVNPEYWGENAQVERVVVRVIPDNQVRVLELQQGRVHLMDYPNPSDIKRLEGDPNIQLLTQEGLNIGYLSFNMKRPPLDQLPVREAISHAINRERIIEEVFEGMGTIAKNPIPPMVLGYNPHLKTPDYDPEKSKQILKEAGLENLKLSLWAMPVARPYNPNARKMAEFMQADLKRVGIEADIVSYDWGTYLEKIGRGEHDLVLIGWTGDNGDPDNFLYTLWSKASAEAVPANNYSFYINEDVDKWLLQAQEISNPRKRAELYRRAIQKMMSDFAFLPIAHSKVVVPARKEIEGYVVQPTGDRWFASVRFKTTN